MNSQKIANHLYTIVNHKYSEGKILYQVLDMRNEKRETIWKLGKEIPDSIIVNYYMKRIKARQESLKLIPKGMIQNPLSVMNHFDFPEEANEDNSFFSSFLNSKPIFLHNSSLKNLGIEKVETLPISPNDNDQKEKSLIEQKQMMIQSDKDAVFVSSSCLASYNPNLFLHIYENRKEEE